MGSDDEEVNNINSSLFRRNSRTGSMRRFLNSSFRRTRKIFGIEKNGRATSTTPINEEIEEESEITEFIRGDCYRVSRISTKSYQILGATDDKIFTNLKPKKAQTNCFLVKYFPKEGKAHDHKSTLNSFERKRRSHQVFGLDHHAKEQLFCPLQASQIEFSFKTLTKTDVIIKVQAPNGEVSSYINPKTHEYTSFTPSNIGCGHGYWYIHLAVRKGCRFHHEATKKIHLVGQGVLFFQIDNHLQITEVEKLWLDCLN